MQARAAVVGCRLGGKGADGTRLYPRLREQTCTSGTPPETESGKAKVLTNVSCFERAIFQSLFRACTGFHLSRKFHFSKGNECSGTRLCTSKLQGRRTRSCS